MIAGRYVELKALTPDWAIEAAEAIGAAGYALLGLGVWSSRRSTFRTNCPPATPDSCCRPDSCRNSIAVGLEVTGAFLIVWTVFLDQALLVRRRTEDPG